MDGIKSFIDPLFVCVVAQCPRFPHAVPLVRNVFRPKNSQVPSQDCHLYSDQHCREALDTRAIIPTFMA